MPYIFNQSYYVIPTNISSPVTNANTTFLLLNNEFRNQTYVSGFQFYASSAGSINIQVNK
jgi:hypothetical protein